MCRMRARIWRVFIHSIFRSRGHLWNKETHWNATAGIRVRVICRPVIPLLIDGKAGLPTIACYVRSIRHSVFSLISVVRSCCYVLVHTTVGFFHGARAPSAPLMRKALLMLSFGNTVCFAVGRGGQPLTSVGRVKNLPGSQLMSFL